MSSPPLTRPEYVREQVEEHDFGVVNKPLTAWERIYGNAALRKVCILVILAAIWQVYATHLDNSLIFPTFTDTMKAFLGRMASGELVKKSWTSIKVLLQGYALGMALALVITMLAMATRIGNDLLETLTAMFNPLPAIALLPVALIWFGLGNGSIIFVLVHAVMWPIALATHSGFMGVSNTLRMVGRNYGLGGFAYVRRILIPAAFPSILSGLKIGWAFAWRTLIAAELVFGTSSGSGGLGWFIYENKNVLDIPAVFAGLFTVIFIGLLVENLIFRTIEMRTVRRWGMHS
ncbi:MAG TPA: ABC transporter permease [Usitatibacter sp.]|jgi:NitT/TauT family transport system permease protein|nr:ABC transporter permease [Usitatibacter sp.]